MKLRRQLLAILALLLLTNGCKESPQTPPEEPPSHPLMDELMECIGDSGDPAKMQECADKVGVTIGPGVELDKEKLLQETESAETTDPEP